LAYRNIRYEGAGGGRAASELGIVDLSEVPWEEVYDYDREFFPDDRCAFLKAWIGEPGHRSLGYRREGKLEGYGVLRKCRSGYKVGPLFAESTEIAEHLFAGLKAHVPKGEPIYLDIPEGNRAAEALVKRHQMTPMFETARMYTGGRPDLPVGRIFGVTTLELG